MNDMNDIDKQTEDCAIFLEQTTNFLDDLAKVNKEQAKIDKTYEARRQSIKNIQELAEEKSILLKAADIIRKYTH